MLVQKIREDLKSAMKAKDPLRVDTLRGAIAAFTNELVAKSMKPTDEVPDDMAVVVLKRLSKQRKDAAEQYEKGARPELAQKELAELKIIETYLPEKASLAAIEAVARAKMSEMSIRSMEGIGKLTGAVMKEFAGSADGGDVRAVLQKLLS